MTVDDYYQIMLYCLSKNSQQGFLSPDEFNLIINQAQRSFLDYLLGAFQQYAVGRPVARVDYSMNEKTRQRLTPLIQAPVMLSIDVTGLALYPTDFEQLDAMFTVGLNRIRYAPQHKLYSYLNSQIDPIAANPVWLMEDDGFRFYPNQTSDPVNGLTAAKLSYVRTPPTILWAFTLDVNGLPVYNSAGSVDPVWYPVDALEIISRALKIAGVNMEAAVVSQYANQIIQQGQ